MGSGVSAKEWVPGEVSRCAFCHEKLGGGPPERDCPRCHARYHGDCWKANDSRCAVYGCEPASTPPAVPAPVVRGIPVAPPSRTRNNWPWWLLIWVSVSILSRLGRCTMDSTPSVPRSIRPLPAPGDDSPSSGAVPIIRELRLEEAGSLIERCRPLLEEVKDGTSLPEDREDRRKLLERVEAALERLVRARQILFQYRTSSSGVRDRDVGEVTVFLDRLMRVRSQLYRVLGRSE